MKKSITKTMLLVMIAIVSVLMVAQIAKADNIKDTKHNLSTTAPTAGVTRTYKVTTGTDEICIFCHTPHGSSASVPLWNRGTPATTTFTLYTSPTLNTASVQPTGVSLACLSCHDGATSFDKVTNKSGSGFGVMSNTWDTTGNLLNTGIANLGTTLADDHPVSFNYSTAIAADTAFRTLAQAKTSGITFYGTGVNTVECASCHNVHDNTLAPFLRMANTGSALCVACHSK